MKYSFHSFIYVLVGCLTIVSCEKEQIKDEPMKPTEQPTKPSNPTEEEPTNPTEPVRTAPTAYFPFDGDLEDVSGNDYYGYGAPMPSFKEGLTSGRKALSFTKSGKEAFVIGDGIIDTRSMTLSFWAKDVSEGDIFHLTSSNEQYGDKMMSLTYRDGHLKYVVKRSNNYYSNYYNSTGNFTHKAVNDGNWHHIALVSDYNTLNYGKATTALYVDGNLMDTVTEDINPFDEKETNHRHFESGTKFILGGENVPMMQIACLRMYADNQLDGSQILEIYNNEQKGIIEKRDTSKKPIPSVDVKSGLSAFFTFDGTLEDLSGNDHYGYGAPTPSFTEGMIYGTQALSFTKTGKEIFAIGEGIIDTRSMSVSFWLKDISEGDIFHLTSTNRRYGDKMMNLAYRDGHLKYVVKRSNSYYSNYYNTTGNFIHKVIDDGEWHHIVITSDYNNLVYGLVTTKLFVDGRIMDTVTEEVNPFDEKESNNCHLGSSSKFLLGGDNVPNMKVACLRLYDSLQLSSDQVMRIYSNELNGIIEKPNNITHPDLSINIRSGLAAYFPFDGNLNDISGNDYYGYGNPDPSYSDGIASGEKSLSFTKTGKETFVVGSGIIDTRMMSICFWVKDISDGNIFHVTSSINEYGDKMMSLTYSDRHLKYVVRRYNNYYANGFSETGNFLHKTIEDGNWHHIALISDYQHRGYGMVTTSLYIDGRIMDTVTEDINPFTEQESNHRHFGAGSKFILGGENVPSMQVAHLRMYDARELNEGEIMALYKNKY